MPAPFQSAHVPGGDPDIEIHLLDFGGSGRPVLLNHANGFCGALWEPVAMALREQFRVFAMDARGHGASSKPDGADRYRWTALGRDAAAVGRSISERHGPIALAAGHSFGGTCLALAASESPGLFERLVLIDPPYPPRREQIVGTFGKGNEFAEGARRRKFEFASREAALERWRGRSMFAPWTERALALYAEFGLVDAPGGGVVLACPPEIEACLFEGIRSCDLADRPESLALPVRFLWASRGNMPREHYERLAADLPDGSVETLDAGHLVLMEQPELVLDALWRFSAPPEARAAASPSIPR